VKTPQEILEMLVETWLRIANNHFPHPAEHKPAANDN
jgi:hypothetical protein